MKLYSGPVSMFGGKAEVAVLEKGLPCERIHVPFNLVELYQPKHPEVLRINPKGQVPVLVDGELELFDSTQIFEYLEDVAPQPPLWPRDARARALARQLELMSDEVFFPLVITIMPQRSQPTAAQAEAARTAIQAYYQKMEHQLEGREFLAGTYSYADIAFYLAQSFADILGAGRGAAQPRLDDWRERLGQRPAVRRVVSAMHAYLAQHMPGAGA